MNTPSYTGAINIYLRAQGAEPDAFWRLFAERRQHYQRRPWPLPTASARAAYEGKLAVDAARREGGHDLAGSDEAGRGSLFGPVVAATVSLPAAPGEQPNPLVFVNDSKQLSRTLREKLFFFLLDHGMPLAIGLATAREIDEVNIAQATLTAIERSLSRWARPCVHLVDGRFQTALPVRHEYMIKGDARSLHIAAASIVAKVTRDFIVMTLASLFPGYGLERNKGYGTAGHFAALRCKGLCRLHRRSFLRKFFHRERQRPLWD